MARTARFGPDNILWQSDMPIALQREAEDNNRVKGIRERIKRLERGERDPYVVDWQGAYYGDVYFLLRLLRKKP